MLDCFGPVVLCLPPCHIHAEAVDLVLVDPVNHVLTLCLHHGRIAVVQFRHIGPIGWIVVVVSAVGDFARFGILVVKVGAFGHPRVVPRGVVGDPVDDELEALLVGGLDEVAKIFLCPKLGINPSVILDGVIGAKHTFAVLHPDRLNGHQPKDVHPHFTQTGQVRLKGRKRTLGGVLTDVDLVHVGIFRPLGVELVGGVHHFFGLGAAGQNQGSRGQGEEFFHGLGVLSVEGKQRNMGQRWRWKCQFGRRRPNARRPG